MHPGAGMIGLSGLPLSGAAIGVALCGGLVLGWAGGAYRGAARLADCRMESAQALIQARGDALASQARAAAATDREVAAAHARADTATAKNRELRHALSKASTGRPCLSADARSLLRGAPAFGPGALPAAAGGAAGAAAGPAGDPGQPDSSDSDVALWIGDAATLYEACRARVDGLRRWREAVSHE